MYFKYLNNLKSKVYFLNGILYINSCKKPKGQIHPQINLPPIVPITPNIPNVYKPKIYLPV